jgi:hypothetical protein
MTNSFASSSSKSQSQCSTGHASPKFHAIAQIPHFIAPLPTLVSCTDSDARFLQAQPSARPR